MKKILLILAILYILSFMNCETELEGEINPFVGTWETETNPKYGFVFTDTQIESYYYNENNKVIWWSGTYIYTDNLITAVLEYRADVVGSENWISPHEMPYSFENNILTIVLTPYKKID